MKPSEVLRKLKWFWNRNFNLGICANFKDHSGQELTFFMRKHGISFENWPEFSGDIVYPVPHKKYSPFKAYVQCVFCFNVFTRYGRARRRLLSWLIKEFEKRGQ